MDRHLRGKGKVLELARYPALDDGRVVIRITQGFGQALADFFNSRRVVANRTTVVVEHDIGVEGELAAGGDDCAKGYIAAHRGSWKNVKHAAQWESTLATYASPIIGALPVATVSTAMDVKVLQQIWHEKTETATRLRGRIESILDWATVSHFRAGDNPARWRGHLDNLLADPGKMNKVVHHAALPWQEIGAFMIELKGREGIAARAVEFAILTATRSGEVRGAVWSEFDLDAAMWVIPAERMKADREHRVPLSTTALALLRAAPRVEEFVFPGMRAETQLSDMSLTAVLRRMGRKEITVHGFRSTFRDWCAESVGNSFPREVCEHALAHSLPDKVEAAYRRGWRGSGVFRIRCLCPGFDERA